MKTQQIFLITLFVCVYCDVYSQLRIAPSGYVGIGTNNPEYNLHVAGRGYFRVGNHVLRIFPDNPGVEIGSSSDKIEFWYSNTGYNKLYADGFIDMSSIFSGNKSLEPIDGSLSKISQLNGIRYQKVELDSNNMPIFTDTVEYFYGLALQDVESVLPEIISSTPRGIKGINYNALIPILIEGIKEQQDSINALKDVISTYEMRFQQIENTLMSCCFQVKSIEKENVTTVFEPSIKSEKQNSNSLLSQNVPNPFSITTTFSYYINRSGFVEFEIYDEFGRLVEKLVDIIQEEGYHTIDWETHGIESGIYIYCLKLDGFVWTKKAIKIKT